MVNMLYKLSDDNWTYYVCTSHLNKVMNISSECPEYLMIRKNLVW